MGDSDSENEGILTNIQRLVIRPPGHTGKAKKGHVCFDGSHETMNLGRVDFITNQVKTSSSQYCKKLGRLFKKPVTLAVSYKATHNRNIYILL